jgi:hypothetical protein
MALTTLPGFTINSSSSFTFASANVTGNTTTNNISITANANTGNLSATGNITASYYFGNGSQLTGIGSAGSLSNGTSNVSIPVTNGNITFNVGGTSNVLVLSNTSANLTGNLTAGNVTAANITGTLLTSSQPQITSVGTLSALSVSGNATILGNVTITGNISYINSSLTFIEDPLIQLGGGANGTSLTTNDGYDRGEILTYYSGSSQVSAFMGWKNANSDFEFASNVSVLNNVVTVNQLGNIRAGNATLTALNVSGTAQFTSNSTIKVGGGANGYLLSTDGSGNLIWLSQSAITAGGTSGNSGSSLQYTAATTPPATGNNLGDQWFNTTNNILYEYITDGITHYWVDTNSPTQSVSNVSSGYVGRSYTGDGVTANFSVSSGANVFNVLVFLDGLCQMPTTDYTISGTTITFIPAPLSGMSIQIRELPR